MEQISFYLQKFKELGLDSLLVKQTFIDTVQKTLSVSLPVDTVEVRGGTVYVQAPPALKSELYIKRHALLAELRKALGPTKISDVR